MLRRLSGNGATNRWAIAPLPNVDAYTICTTGRSGAYCLGSGLKLSPRHGPCGIQGAPRSLLRMLLCAGGLPCRPVIALHGLIRVRVRVRVRVRNRVRVGVGLGLGLGSCDGTAWAFILVPYGRQNAARSCTDEDAIGTDGTTPICQVCHSSLLPPYMSVAHAMNVELGSGLGV